MNYWGRISISDIIAEYENSAKEKGNKGSYNKLGIICASFSKYELSEKAFNSALAIDRNYLAATINLANVYYMQEEYHNALRIFHDARTTLIDKGRETSSTFEKVLLNISKAYYELENYDKSIEYSEQLLRLKDEKDKLEKAYFNVAEPVVMVTKTIYPGTLIKIKDATFEVTNEFSRVMFRLIDGEITYSNLS